MKLVLAFPPLSILVKVQQDDQNSNHFILMETIDDDADNDDDYGLPISHLIPLKHHTFLPNKIPSS